MLGHVALELVDEDCVRRNPLHEGILWVALLRKAALVAMMRSDILTVGAPEKLSIASF